MSWLNLDDQFARHPKMVALGPFGLALQVRVLCYCAQYLTDGFVPNSIVRSFTTDLPGTADEWIEKMCFHKVWQRQESGFLIHDYLVYNLSKTQIETARKLKARGGKHSQQNQHIRRYAQSHLQSSPQRDDKASLKHSPLPLLIKKEKKEINPTSPSPTPSPVLSTPTGRSEVDRTTQGFESVSDGIASVLKVFAPENGHTDFPDLPESRALRIHGTLYNLAHPCQKHPDQSLVAVWDQLTVKLTDAHCPQCRQDVS